MTPNEPREPKPRIELWKLLVLVAGIVVVIMVIKPTNPDAASTFPTDKVISSAPDASTTDEVPNKSDSQFDDTVQYDPNAAARTELANRIYLDTRNCTDFSIRSDLNHGIKSRKELVEKAVPICTGEMLGNRLETRVNAELYVRAYAYSRIDAIASEGR